MGELWLTEQGAQVGVDHNRLVVSKGEDRLAECPLGQLERVVILGNVQVTTPALQRLLRQGIALVFLGLDGQYYGRLTGQVTPPLPALPRARWRVWGSTHTPVSCTRTNTTALPWPSTCARSFDR